MEFPREGLSNTEGIQCYECKGFGHIQSECPTYFKRKNKSYVTTLSDDSDSEEDNNTNFVAFTANHENDNGNENDIQELLESYTQLHAKWEHIIKVNLELMEENQFLKDEKDRGEKRFKEAQNELLESKNREAKLLQEIKVLTERPRSSNSASGEGHPTENPEVSQHHFQHRRRIRCYYCHRLGHIKAYCFKRQNDLYYRQNNRDWAVQSKNNSKKIWVRKDQNVAYTSKTSKEQNVWYFDSGCSRHMTGNPENLENIQYKNEGHVTFGDGGKGQIIASGILNVHGLPRLPKVLLVQSLKTNLISISQLCEDELKVEFSKDNCTVFNQNHKCVMMGKRSANKCYTWDGDLSGLQTTIKQKQSRHQHMGHINSHDIKGDQEIFLDYSGYSSNSKAFSVDSTMESMNVVINDTISRITTNDDESPRVVETTVPTPLTTVMQNHKTETEPDEEKDDGSATIIMSPVLISQEPYQNIQDEREPPPACLCETALEIGEIPVSSRLSHEDQIGYFRDHLEELSPDFVLFPEINDGAELVRSKFRSGNLDAIVRQKRPIDGISVDSCLHGQNTSPIKRILDRLSQLWRRAPPMCNFPSGCRD